MRIIREPRQIARGAVRRATRLTAAARWKLLGAARRRRLARDFRHIRRERRDRCWCGGTLAPFPHHPSYRVCRDCGAYVNTRPPVEADLVKLYSLDLYWKKRQSAKGFPTIENRAELYRRDGRLERWLGLIDRFVSTPGTVVEVGCAPGVLLQELSDRGWETVGVEISPAVAQWLREHCELDVRAGAFPDVDLPACDLFLAFDVLEHSPHPDDFMREAARMLRPGGIAIIQTAVDRYDYDPPFGPRFDIFDDLEHLFLFTDRSLERLAERGGLEVLDLREQIWVAGEIGVFRRPREATSDV